MTRVPINPRAPLTGSDGSPTRYGLEYLKANETIVDDEAAARIAADNALAQDISDEATARAAADNALAQDISDETAARIAADNALAQDIADEEAARIAADNALQAQISAFPVFLTATASLDFPSIAAQSQQELTITVTGAAVGDAVALGPPAGLDAGLSATGYVSAADTVTVRLVNATAGAVDPGAATWRATVMQA